MLTQIFVILVGLSAIEQPTSRPTSQPTSQPTTAPAPTTQPTGIKWHRSEPMRIGDSRFSTPLNPDKLTADKLKAELSLTEEQRKKIEQIYKEYQKVYRSAEPNARLRLRNTLTLAIHGCLTDVQKKQLTHVAEGGSFIISTSDINMIDGYIEGKLTEPHTLFKCLQDVDMDEEQEEALKNIKFEFERLNSSALPPDEKYEAEEELFDNVLEVLDEEQAKQLIEVHEEAKVRQVADSLEPRKVCYAVMKLNKTAFRVTRKQMNGVKRLRNRYQKVFKKIHPNDYMGRYRINQQFAEDVMALLTPEQQDEVLKVLVER